jgi:hypothetical protein
MKLQNKAVILYIVLAASNLSADNNLEKLLSAKETVEKFCSSEFIGIQDVRLDMAKYTPMQKKIEAKRDSEFRGMVKYWENDPIYVVSSYHIVDLSVQKDHAVATIAYKVVAHTKGDGVFKREFIAIGVVNDLMKLHLIYDESKWWILDPPTPRISIEAISKYYANKINVMGQGFRERSDISEQQKRYYQNLQKNLELLNGLQHN